MRALYASRPSLLTGIRDGLPSVVATAAVLLFVGGPGPKGLMAQEEGDLGKATYDRWCAGCHGVDGSGNGPGALIMLPRPRDFTQALYQIRSTATGELPTDEDILNVINKGMPGTTMPGWEEQLSEDERQALVQYLKSFSRFFSDGAPEPLDLGRPTHVSDEVLAEGRAQYEAIECWRCHGEEGRGEGESAPTLGDDKDFPIRARDLTENWFFNGGGTVEDIYRSLRTGLDGTPMPNFSDLIDAQVITDDQLWALAHYVRSLAPEEAPGINEVIRASLLEDEALPTHLDDPLWDAAQPAAYIPLAGQIIVKPRWFDPRVGGLWVQALHDGQNVAVRIRWSDPNHSPDPAWTDWTAQVISLMDPQEGDPAESGPSPDQLLVQFPMQMPQGMERPYFMRGDNRRPVYLWQWQSDRAEALEGEARGIGTENYPEDGQDLLVTAVHEYGQWEVMFTRSLVTEDVGDLDFPTGEPIPIAFFAWDGDNGESGSRGAVSSWYFLFLQGATPNTVYVAPTLAIMVTAGLGILVVGRAQRREQEGNPVDEA